MSFAEKRRIALFGATGSIGTSCLDVVRAYPDDMEIRALTAHSRWRDLAAACEEFRPRYVVLTGLSPDALPANAFPAGVEVRFGMEQLIRCATDPAVDTVVSAIVGAAGLHGTWAAVEAGKRVGLANKETLVVAGPLIMELAARTGATLIPVDSEHSAIFQGLQCGRRDDLQRLILTASGGPFRTWTADQLARVTAQDALAHPTWDMGQKITIDSATMMNKSLEVIEARWLFDVPVDQIEVVVHPQSIVHSLVEFRDGSTLAQLSPPDMRLPIQYALTWPDRLPGLTPSLDLSSRLTLEFEPPDFERFPALELGFAAAREGGTLGAVLNAANEVAVRRFLDGTIPFLDIPRLCRSILEAHEFESTPALETLLRLDAWAREEAFRWQSPMSSHSPSALARQRC